MWIKAHTDCDMTKAEQKLNKSRNVVKKKCSQKEKKKKMKVILKKKSSLQIEEKERRFTDELPSKYYSKVSQAFASMNELQRHPLGSDVIVR